MTLDERLGGWAISFEVAEFISTIIKPGNLILELGSGSGTGYLSRKFNMISVENNPEFLNLENSKYIYAPITEYADSPFHGEKGWYDPNILEKELPSDYDLLLIDGPHGRIGRSGILLHLHLFRPDRPVIVDDSHRPTESNIAQEICRIWDMDMREFDCGEESNDGVKRKFHVLLPKSGIVTK